MLKQIVLFFVIVTMCYFSHLVAFYCFGNVLGLFELMDFFFFKLKENLKPKCFEGKLICFEKQMSSLHYLLLS